MSRRTGDAVSIAATLSMRRAEEAFLGGDRIGLLEAIDRFGSISRAAREVGVSYKTAWDTMGAKRSARSSRTRAPRSWVLRRGWRRTPFSRRAP